MAAHQRRPWSIQTSGRSCGRRQAAAGADEDLRCQTSSRAAAPADRRGEVSGPRDGGVFDLVPENTYVTITSDHGELFGEDGYFGHGPIQHEKVWKCRFWRARCGDAACISPISGPGAGFAFLGSFLTLVLSAARGLGRRCCSGRFGWRGCWLRRKAGAREGAGEEDDLPGAGRAGPGADRTFHGGRQAAQPGRLAANRDATGGCAPRSPPCRRWRGPRSPPA